VPELSQQRIGRLEAQLAAAVLPGQSVQGSAGSRVAGSM
jgi:hypothetical protein